MRDIEYGRAYSKARGYHNREVLAQAKLRAGCAICGYSASAAALDFNHYKGEKTADITKMVTYAAGRIWDELEKCVVLCANCHRIYTHSTPVQFGEFVKSYVQKGGQ